MKQHSPGFLKLVNEAKTRVNETDVASVAARLQRGDAFHLVDVREESEYAAAHIPGALHLSKGIIERDIEKRIPNTNAPIVLYCGGGFRAALVADNIQRMGYTNVLSMAGGWSAWQQSGNPIE
jgi:rhodanese-related sulfurtransferase